MVRTNSKEGRPKQVTLEMGRKSKLHVLQSYKEECKDLTINSVPVKLKMNDMGKTLQPSYLIWIKKIEKAKHYKN